MKKSVHVRPVGFDRRLQEASLRRLRRGFTLSGLLVLILLVPLLFDDVRASAVPDSEPFDPARPGVYLSQGASATSPTTLYVGNSVNGKLAFEQVGPSATAAFTYNALGYNTLDNYMYAVASSAAPIEYRGHLVRIASDGSATALPLIPGNSLSPVAPSSPVVGAFDDEGNLYLQYGQQNLVRVNIATMAITTQIMSQPVNLADWTYADGYLWSLARHLPVASSINVARIDPATGTTTTFLLDPAFLQGKGGNWGAAWTFGNGNLGFANNLDGLIVQLKVTDPGSGAPRFDVVSLQPGPAAVNNNDGTSIIGGSTDLGVSLTAPATVRPGASLEHVVTVTNRGPATSSGYVVTLALPSEIMHSRVPEGLACMNLDKTILRCVADALAPGVTMTYRFGGSAIASDETLKASAVVLGNEVDNEANNNHAETQTIVTGLGENEIMTPLGPVAVYLSDGRVFVSTFDDDQIHVIDQNTNTVTASIPVARYPVAFEMANEKLYVVSQNTGFPNGIITVIDPQTNEVLSTISLWAGATDVVQGSDGRIFVAGSGGFIYVIDPASDTLVNTYWTSTQNAYGIIAGSNGNLYVTDSDGIVIELDPATGAVANRFELTTGSAIAGTAGKIAETNNRLYLTQAALARVIVLDTATGVVLGTITTGQQPVEIELIDGYLYVTDRRSHSVTVIDPLREGYGAVIGSLPVGNGPRGVAGENGKTYVANYEDNLTTVLHAPNVVTGLTANVSESTVTLSWLAPKEPGSLPTNEYQVRYRAVDEESWLIINTLSSETRFRVEGLANGRSYEFQVVPRNLVGLGSASAGITATPRANEKNENREEEHESGSGVVPEGPGPSVAPLGDLGSAVDAQGTPRLAQTGDQSAQLIAFGLTALVMGLLVRVTSRTRQQKQ